MAGGACHVGNVLGFAAGDGKVTVGDGEGSGIAALDLLFVFAEKGTRVTTISSPIIACFGKKFKVKSIICNV